MVPNTDLKKVEDVPLKCRRLDGDKVKLLARLSVFCMANLATLASIQFIARILSVHLRYRLQFCNLFYMFGALAGVLVVSQCSSRFSIRVAVVFVWGILVAALSSSTYELEKVHWPSAQMFYRAVSEIPFVAFFAAFIFWRFAELLKISLTNNVVNAFENRLTIAELLITTLATGLFIAMSLNKEKEFGENEYGMLIASAAFAVFLFIAWYCGRSIFAIIAIAMLAATGIAIHLTLPRISSYLYFTITFLAFYLTLNQFAFSRFIQPLLPLVVSGRRTEPTVT